MLQSRKLARIDGAPLHVPPNLQTPIRDVLAVADAARYAGGNVAKDQIVNIGQDDFDDILFVFIPSAANVSVNWL